MLFVALGVVVSAVAFLSVQGKGSIEALDADAQKALSLQISKRKYDDAKSKVKSLSEEFSKLKSQLQEQVHNLQSAKSNLVSQIASVQGSPVLAGADVPIPPGGDTDGEDGVPVPPEAADNDEENALGEDAHTLPPSEDEEEEDDEPVLSASSRAHDAANAAEHALHYTQQVASRVGDLADQSEEQAERIVDAARLTQEAKEAMQSALEQSSRIVDYNTHAAQQVAQDSGFVSTGAQTIAGYMKDIFHDARAVHAAAVYAVQHMNRDVSAADHAVSEIESDAEEAAEVLEHINQADSAATAFARHAHSSAVTAAQAADGALQGQRAAMAGGVRAVAAAHSAESASQAAQEHAHAAAWANAVHPPAWYHPALPVPAYGVPTYNGVPYPEDAKYTGEALVEAKALVEAVVALMQQLTNALQAAGDNCGKVDQILAYYQAQMARYHSKGQLVAASLSDEDLDLVQKYAEAQVQPFAADLQEAVEAAAKACQIPVAAFIPDVNFDGAPAPAPPKDEPAAAEAADESAGPEEEEEAPEEEEPEEEAEEAARGTSQLVQAKHAAMRRQAALKARVKTLAAAKRASAKLAK